MNRREAALALAGLAIPAVVPAQGPAAAKPVRLIVPFPAGGPVDVVGRRLAAMVGPALGSAIIVENRTGASGSIGTAELLRADPDGSTLALAIPDSLISIASLLKSPPYDARKDLTPITQMVASPLVMMASEALGVSSLAELMAQARRQPGRLGYGSWGPGTMPHLIMAALERGSTARFLHVPYRGVAPALQDLAAGQVQIGFGPAHVAAQYAQKRFARPIALSGPERSPLLPQTATLAQQGYSGPIEQSRVWIGLVGPLGLPRPVVDRWFRAMHQAVQDPEFQKFLAGMGFVPLMSSPSRFAGDLDAEFTVTNELIRSLGITAA